MGVGVTGGKSSRAGSPEVTESANAWEKGAATGDIAQVGKASIACTPTLPTSDTGMACELTVGSSRTKLGGGVANGE